MPKEGAEEAEYTKEAERRLAPFPETCFVEMRLSREVILSGGGIPLLSIIESP